MYVTITGSEYYMGIESYKIGQLLLLKKDEENRYDDEAIKVETPSGALCGFVANSVDTVARGTHSSGYIYSLINDSKQCEVKFILNNSVIAKIL